MKPIPLSRITQKRQFYQCMMNMPSTFLNSQKDGRSTSINLLLMLRTPKNRLIEPYQISQSRWNIGMHSEIQELHSPKYFRTTNLLPFSLKLFANSSEKCLRAISSSGNRYHKSLKRLHILAMSSQWKFTNFTIRHWRKISNSGLPCYNN